MPGHNRARRGRLPLTDRRDVFQLVDEYEDDDEPIFPPMLMQPQQLPATVEPVQVLNVDELSSGGEDDGHRKRKKLRLEEGLEEGQSSAQNEEIAHLKCLVCLGVTSLASDKAHLPHVLNCGHIFGEECITTWMKGMPSTCPNCKAPALPADVKKIFPYSARDEVLEEAIHRADEADAVKAQADDKIGALVKLCYKLKNCIHDYGETLNHFKSWRR